MEDLLAWIRNVILFFSFFWTMMIFGSFISNLMIGQDIFWDLNVIILNNRRVFVTERDRSRDWCTRSYLKFHGSYLFLVLAG